MTADQTSRILKSVILALNLKTYEFADSLKINRQQLYDYTRGKSVPMFSVWANIKAIYPTVSGDFLLSGKGQILNE